MTTGALMVTSHDRVLDAANADHQDSDEVVASSSSKAIEDSSKVTGWIARLTGMQGGSAEGFQSILPSNIALTPPRGLFVNENGTVAIALTQGRLMRFEANHQEDSQASWRLVANHTLSGETTRGSTLAVSGNVVLIARPDERTVFLDAIDLQPLGTVELPSSLSVTSAIAIGDQGRFAIITTDAKCRLVDTKTESAFVALINDPLPIREVDALHVDTESNALLIVHHVDQVDWCDLDDLTVTRRLRPSLSRWRLVDKYLVTPLRTITPQTGELGGTIASMISGKSAVTLSNGATEEPETVRYKIARPLTSCAGFIVVMLTISCLYFARSDF
jgi:hypothetical protein